LRVELGSNIRRLSNISLPALREMKEKFGEKIYAQPRTEAGNAIGLSFSGNRE
jgi:hypothetical protein